MIRVRIWECRERKGVSLRELERSSGISRSTLQRAESGLVSPTLDQLDRIASTLKISIADLFLWEKPSG